MIAHQLLLEDEECLRFQHDLVRAVVYEDLRHWRRRQLHRRAAAAMVELYSHQLESAAALIAGHYELAAEAAQAVDYLQKAAGWAQRQHAHEEAAALLLRAIALLPKAEPETSVVLKLHESLADSLMATGHHKQAHSHNEKAANLAAVDDRLKLADLYRKAAAALVPQFQHDKTLSACEKALSALGTAPEEPDSAWYRRWLEIQLGRMEVYYFANQPDTIAALAEEIRPRLEAFGTPAHRRDFLGNWVQ